MFSADLAAGRQVRPEANLQEAMSSEEEYTELGIPVEWVQALQKLGFTTIAKLKELEKPGKLANNLNGCNKKNKLGLKGLSPDMVGEWIS